MLKKQQKAWCMGCMKSTLQTIESEGKGSYAGNKTLTCIKCKTRNTLIQGFNSNLM